MSIAQFQREGNLRADTGRGGGLSRPADLTVFTIPKPFQGSIDLIQRNAIGSWLRLRPQPEVILFGDDPGTSAVAAEFSVRHEGAVARTGFGTPVVGDIFKRAEALARRGSLLCYVNADIILMGDFREAIRRIAGWASWFLLVGQRWDVDIRGPLDHAPGSEERLRSYVAQAGRLHGPTGIDYFVFPPGLWGEIPPFAVGRTAWDNWLLYRARARRAPLIDATQVVMAVHQNHDYSHASKGEAEVWHGPEARRNLQMAGGWPYLFTLHDATHRLTPDGRIASSHCWRMAACVHTMLVRYPWLRGPACWLVAAASASRAMQSRLRDDAAEEAIGT